ncbi:MAG: S8 family serine peptidase, partial [Lachnospiraceae bacterium]|nr:S8 family serine peptidase [Lachnospiraceae bacterium]
IEANGINGGMNRGMAQWIGTEYNVIESGTGNEPPVNPENPDPEKPDPEHPRDPSVLMQGIIRYEATEGLEDIGEAYFKDITSMDDIGYTIEGYPCVKNQLLLTSKEGVTFTQIEELVHSYDAEIVGYLELTDDYQIEFYEEIPPERLRTLMEELAQNGLVEYCDYNLSAEINCDFYTNDAELNKQNQSLSWNSSKPDGDNWNVEMIDLEGALVNAGVISANAANADFSDLSDLTTVRIGLIDTAFDVWHEDMEYVTVWNNYSNPVDLRMAASMAGGMDHGSHVAGIMAAGYNNGKGITGICLKPFLYGFSMYGDTLSYAATERDSIMKLQYALDIMIGNHVKVINYSWENATYAFAASQQEQYAIVFLEKRTAKINHFLVRLINKGYDFLIVASAGNTNDDQFYKYTFENEEISEERYVSVADYRRSNNRVNDYPSVDTSITYGALNSHATISCNEVDAKYSTVFSYSRDIRVQNRVIVVGAIEKPTGITGTYNVANFSNTGSRVDILAPGDAILSCVISGMGKNYKFKSGTSMAAPHVSGVAGLAYNVDPDISASELKDIIVNNYQMTIDGYRVLNAAEVIAAVSQYETLEKEEEYTVQLHVMGADGSGVGDALVEVRSRSFYWCKVLGAAMRSDAVGGAVVYSGKTDAAGNIKLNIPQGNYYVLVDGEYGGVQEEISVSSEDIMEQAVKEITLLDYQPEETRGVILQLSSSTEGENVNSYGLIIHGEFRFLKGWIDAADKENIRIENYVREGELTAEGGESIAVYHTRADFGDISVRLPEGIYTVEVTLPDAEPKYYHIIISDKYDFTFYRFEM